MSDDDPVSNKNPEFFFRFRKPEKVSPWEGVLDGTKMPNTCVQVKLDFEYFGIHFSFHGVFGKFFRRIMICVCYRRNMNSFLVSPVRRCGTQTLQYQR